MSALPWHGLLSSTTTQGWYLVGNPEVQIHGQIAVAGHLYDYRWRVGHAHHGIEQSIEACEEQIIPILLAKRMMK